MSDTTDPNPVGRPALLYPRERLTLAMRPMAKAKLFAVAKENGVTVTRLVEDFAENAYRKMLNIPQKKLYRERGYVL